METDSWSMATSSHSRSLERNHDGNLKNHSGIKTTITPTVQEPLIFGRIPYSSMKTAIETISSTPSSPNPNTREKQLSKSSKRRSSSASLTQFIPRRKSLQTTALASQRQSLWISIAKNANTNDSQTSSLALRHPERNLLRKKFLRLLLVFSYLLSISLFAIALATFYGFFWSGYSTTSTSDASTTDPLILNSTLMNTNTSS